MGSKDYKKTLFACYRGYIVQAVVVNLSPLFFVIFQDRYDVSFVMLGNLVLLNFGVQLSTDALSVKFIERIGYRKAALFAHTAACIGIVLLGVLPLFLPIILSLVISTIIFAVGGGLLEVIISPVVESLPSYDSKQAMCLLHSFYCWGVVLVILLTTGILFAVGKEMWWIIPILWAVLPLYNFLSFLKVPIIPPLSQKERMPLKELLKTKGFLVVMLLMMCAGASELGLAQWVSLFTEKALGVSKTVGDILGPCFFAVMMGIGRVAYGIYGEKIKLLTVITYCSVLCIISYLMCSLSESPVLSLIGCALCGLAVSIMWPGMISYAAGTFKTGGAALFAVLALSGDTGCSVGPWLVGAVSQAAINLSETQALKLGVLSCIIFPIIMLIGSLYFKWFSKEGSEEVGI